MTRLLDYGYILATIGLTVYGQLMMKWRMSKVGALPAGVAAKIKFLLSLLIFDPLIFSCYAAALFAALAWMAAMTRFDLSHAYPFMSLNFVIVLVLSAWFLSEPLSFQKVVGVGMIAVGTVIASRG